MMNECLPKPSGFSLRRYPERLWQYFPPHWRRGVKLPNDRRAMAGAPEVVGSRQAICERLGLTVAQLSRALRLGMPFKQDDRWRYSFVVPVCRAWLREHEDEVLSPPDYGRRPLDRHRRFVRKGDWV